MRRRRFRWDMRTITLTVAAVSIGVALLILWFGYRFDRATDLLIAQGRVAEGRYLSTSYGACTNDGCDDDTIHVAYAVNGTAYRTSMAVPRANRSEALFDTDPIPVPRFGPERPLQVVYLPSDPSRARLRAGLKRADAAFYGTAGMFLFAGLVFGAFGLFVLNKPFPGDE